MHYKTYRLHHKTLHILQLRILAQPVVLQIPLYEVLYNIQLDMGKNQGTESVRWLASLLYMPQKQHGSRK